MIYLDSSALTKLVVDEPESATLEAWLVERPDGWASSEIAITEVRRAVRALTGRHREEARALVLGSLTLIPVTRAILNAAAVVDPAVLRSLDAIHLASALTVADVIDTFVAYDRNLLAAARKAGLATASPGQRPANRSDS